MSKLTVYIVGAISGALIVSGVFAILSKISTNQSKPEIKLFESPGPTIDVAPLITVFQVWDDGSALATAGLILPSCTVYLLPNKNKSFYDGQIIEYSEDKQCLRQIGTCRYRTDDDEIKTVPIVKLFPLDKQPVKKKKRHS